MKFICFLTFMTLYSMSYAQDVIVKNTKEKIEAKILKIGENEVEYKKASNLNGPIYTIKKDEIFIVLYANGEQESFDKIKQKVHMGDSDEIITEDETDSAYDTEGLLYFKLNTWRKDQYQIGKYKSDINTIICSDVSYETFLTQMKIYDFNSYESFLSNKRNYNIGSAFSNIFSAIGFGTGIIAFRDVLNDYDTNIIYISLASFGVGLAFEYGLMRPAYDAAIKTVEGYNEKIIDKSKITYGLDLKINPNGIGLVFQF